MIRTIAASLRGRQRVLALVIAAELVAGLAAVPAAGGGTPAKRAAAGQVAADVEPPTSIGAPATSTAPDVVAATAAPTTKGTVAPPPAPIRVAPGPGSATVSWNAFGGAPPAFYTVTASEPQFGQVASLTACGTCLSVRFRGLVDGRKYTFTVTAPGRSTKLTSPPASPATDLCPPTPVCVAVDGAAGLGPATRRADGFLGGIDAHTDVSRVAALRPTSWRAGSGTSKGRDEDAAIRRFTPNITQIVSNYWVQSTYNKDRGGARPPWDDWDLYSSYVTQLVQAVEQQGWAPAYWEVANEPDAGYPYPPGTVVTIENTLKMYDVGYHAIKAADPNARVVGPSLTGFTHDPISDKPELLDLTTFLDYANAHGLHFDALTLHETGASHLKAFDRRPEAATAHVDQLRSELIKWPNVGQPQIFVDEYGSGGQLDFPGWRVGYIASTELADVGLAASSCWLFNDSSPAFCNAHSLDGLLDNDQTTPRAPYWLYLDYANMSGTRLTTSSSDQTVTGFATSDGGGGPVRVLVGRHHSCPGQNDPQCPQPASAAPGPVPVTVAVRVGGADRPVRVGLQRLQATRDPVPDAPPTQTISGTVHGGVVQLVIPSFDDGDAYAITVS